MFERMTEGIWRYHDAMGSTSYLVLGQKMAAMIDCGGTGMTLMPQIRKITDLPVILLLTHAHPDHYGSAAEFDEVWLHEEDVKALPVFEAAFAVMGVRPLDRKTLHAFSDGQVFDLGGRQLRACAIYGHTPGSVVFVDEGAHCLFCGDAVGSGDIVLMSVPLAYDLSAYRNSLLRFMDRSRLWEDFIWYSGHFHQADRGEGVPPNTPCRALVGDMIELCDAILAGKKQGERTKEIFAPNGEARRAYMGRAGIVYTDEQVK